MNSRGVYKVQLERYSNLNEENKQTPSKNDLKKTLQKYNYTYVGIKQTSFI